MNGVTYSDIACKAKSKSHTTLYKKKKKNGEGKKKKNTIKHTTQPFPINGRLKGPKVEQRRSQLHRPAIYEQARLYY